MSEGGPRWTLTYDLTREQVVESTVAASLEMFADRRRHLTGALAALGVVCGLLTWSRAGAAVGLLFLLMGLGGAVLTWVGGPSSTRSVVVQSLRRHGEQGLVGRHELTVDARGLRERTDVNERYDAWRTVSRIVQDDRFVYLHLPGLLVYAIPKTAFVDGADVDAFVQAAARWRAGG